MTTLSIIYLQLLFLFKSKKIDNYIKKTNIFNKIKYPKYIVGILGTSNKKEIANLLFHVLKNNKYKVLIFDKNNIIKYINPFTKKIKKNILIVNSNYNLIVNYTHIIINNISRYNLTSNITPNNILNKIIPLLNDNTNLIINADNPILNKLKYEHNGLTFTYGINNTEYSTKLINNNIDFAYCPFCGNKLKYSYYHLENLGKYKCNKCDFSRGKLNIEADEVNLEKQYFIANNSIYYSYDKSLFSVYSTLSVITFSKLIGIKTENIQKYINDIKINLNNNTYVKYKNKKIYIKLIELEDSISFSETITNINNLNKKVNIIFSFDKISNNYNDISYLYDIDFNILNNKNIDNIFIIGKFRYDILTRLNYTKIDTNKLLLVDNIKSLKKYLNESTIKDFYFISNENNLF